MILAEFALAAGVLAAFPPPVVEPIPTVDDCAKPKVIPKAAPRRVKPAATVQHRRLFKTDPKVAKEEEPPCQAEAPRPVITALPDGPELIEDEPQLSVPLITVERLVFSDEPIVPDALALPPESLPPFEPPLCCVQTFVVVTPAVPEPAEIALLAFGLLGLLGWRARA